eukprot:2460332-Pyramimonas_sp.AAC.1
MEFFVTRVALRALGQCATLHRREPASAVSLHAGLTIISSCRVPGVSQWRVRPSFISGVVA